MGFVPAALRAGIQAAMNRKGIAGITSSSPGGSSAGTSDRSLPPGARGRSVTAPAGSSR